MDAIAQIDVKPPWLTKERLVAGGAAAVAVAGGVVLAFHQPAANQFRRHNFCRTAEKGVGQRWEILGDGLGAMGVASKDSHYFAPRFKT